MEINSAANSGYLGFQRATQQLGVSSEQIAKAATQPESSDAGTELTRELVKRKVAETSAAASAKVVKSADEVMGTLIDIRV